MENNWKNIESEFLDFYKGDKEELGEDTERFLEKINFLSEGETTELGEEYLDSKYIFENGNHQAILRHEVLNISEIRELCQSFYGQETDRKNVERFFNSKTEIQDEKKVGRVLALLNGLGIVSYSTKTGTVQFKQSEQVEEQDQSTYRVTSRTPYSNIKRLRKAIRTCERDLRWVAKHFSKKGLEPLAEEVTGNKFSSVRILCGPANVSLKMRDDFERFREEMDNRGIDAELRVIVDESRLREIHDRWIISDEVSWNVPPVNSLYQNQEAEIHKTSKELPFDEWWEDGEDIIDDWNSIQGHI